MQGCVTGCSRGVLILLLTAGAAWAQATAQLSGTVRDEGGAFFPRYRHITQTTGLVRTPFDGTAATADEPSDRAYQLDVSLRGFQTSGRRASCAGGCDADDHAVLVVGRWRVDYRRGRGAPSMRARASVPSGPQAIGLRCRYARSPP